MATPELFDFTLRPVTVGVCELPPGVDEKIMQQLLDDPQVRPYIFEPGGLRTIIIDNELHVHLPDGTDSPESWLLNLREELLKAYNSSPETNND